MAKSDRDRCKVFVTKHQTCGRKASDMGENGRLACAVHRAQEWADPPEIAPLWKRALSSLRR